MEKALVNIASCWNFVLGSSNFNIDEPMDEKIKVREDDGNLGRQSAEEGERDSFGSCGVMERR